MKRLPLVIFKYDILFALDDACANCDRDLMSAKYRNYEKYGGNGLSLASIYIVSVANRLDLP